MAALGGYFAVSYLAEHVVTDALDATWRVLWRDAAGAKQWGADTPFGRLEASGAVSVDKPTVAFRGAVNGAVVEVSGAGRFELTLAGASVGGAFAAIDATVTVPVVVSQEDMLRKAVVDLSGMVLDTTQLRLTWFAGPTAGDSQVALLEQETRRAITEEVRKRLTRFLTFLLPTDEMFLAELTLMTQGVPGSVIFTPLIKLGAARVLDGWLAIGVDATSDIAKTHGNPESIGPPPEAPHPGPTPLPQADIGDGSLRLLADPATVITYLMANARFALRMATALRPNIHPVEEVVINFDNDTIVVRAGGTVDAPDPFFGQAPFNADVHVRPFIPKNARTVYASIKPDIRVDVPWFLEVLGAIAELIGFDVFGKLRRANKSEMAILFPVRLVRKVIDFGDLEARVEGRQIVVRPDLVGFYGEAQVRSFWSGPSMDLTPKVWGGFHIRDRFLRLRLHPLTHLATDPTYLIRYRLRRGSNGLEVASGTAWSGSDEPFGDQLDLWDEAIHLETAFTAELVAERPPGVPVAHHTQSVTIWDLFDRSHPFARWRKKHFFGGPNPQIRLSAVHRTAIRERCKFCDVGTRRDKSTYTIQAIDSLPAPEEDGFSSRLCPYCFPEG